MADECAQCGSAKVIPNVPLKDHFGDWGMRSNPATVEVYTKPDAWMFTGAVSGQLNADICGDCGHIELRVNNPQKLYEAYLKSKGEPVD